MRYDRDQRCSFLFFSRAVDGWSRIGDDVLLLESRGDPALSCVWLLLPLADRRRTRDKYKSRQRQKQKQKAKDDPSSACLPAYKRKPRPSPAAAEGRMLACSGAWHAQAQRFICSANAALLSMHAPRMLFFPHTHSSSSTPL